MKRTTRFVQPIGLAVCHLPDGQEVQLPIVPGIFKYAPAPELEGLLHDPAVARKYTLEALRVAPWQVLRLFPRDWLLECLQDASLRDSRRQALEFMLAPPER